jgi:DNA repair protein RecN (Recombination protein N)
MLKSLSIKNYALINGLEIDFDTNMNILTGETGAGKSIILGALGLILGQRADNKVFFDPSKKCIMEGTFDVSAYQVKHFFNDHDLDYSDTTFLRREITPEGKSRAFINDTPCTLALLKELGASLVDIHSQHENLKLNSESFQMEVLDLFSAHKHELITYKVSFKELKNLEQLLNDLSHKQQDNTTDLDYIRFQWEELDKAALAPGEIESLEGEFNKLNHAETIRESLSKALFLFDNDENGALLKINDANIAMGLLGSFGEELDEISKRIGSSLIELKDIHSELERISEDTNVDQGRLSELSDRLNLLNHLCQKHKVSTTDQLIELRESFNSSLSGVENMDEEIQKLKSQVTKQRSDVISKAKEISANRKKQIPSLELKIKDLLNKMGMPNAMVKVDQQKNEELPNQNGIDRISFLFSANKGMDFREIGSVASGGELSRLMLSLKSIMAEFKALPTLIFDEVDTGVSGEVAHKVGLIMEGLATNHQIITITHLPQIASKGNSHFFVYKEHGKDRTSTNIKKLTGEERITEIAKMLSGENPTPIALENASELLGH